MGDYMKSSAISLSSVNKSFLHSGRSYHVLNDISFNVKAGEIVTLLGESGCGKSAILSMIGGFKSPDSGEVRINGEIVKKPNRNCITLFQKHNLFPWRNVFDNVMLALNGDKEKNKERALEALKFVGLSDHLFSYPHELSSGMKQRVSIARAFAIKPDVILLDEPFAALDMFNRHYLQDELIRMQQQDKVTIVLVTHDVDEAVYLSDRVIVMSTNPGEIYKMIEIKLPKPRDRSYDQFHQYRSKIYDIFTLSGSKKSYEQIL